MIGEGGIVVPIDNKVVPIDNYISHKMHAKEQLVLTLVKCTIITSSEFTICKPQYLIAKTMSVPNSVIYVIF